MGLHTGEVEERGGDYFGPAVNRAARLKAVGHGGQVLVSAATAELVDPVALGEAVLVDVGEHRLRDLSRPERVFELAGPGLVGRHPPLRSLDASATNLPVQLTTFVGREEELQAISSALVDHRMVTVTGVGGVGKSRLALQAAADMIERFEGGCWLVELAPVVEGDRLLEAVSAALGVTPTLGATVEESVLDALRGRRTLIVLDNCEHLLGDARRAVTAMLRAGTGAVVLATSREPLGVPGEQVFGLASLDEPTAVRLFAERASDADAAFAMSDADLSVVGRLCRRLDGIPLAIELAAARVRMFSVAELAGRVDQRFRLLTGGRGAVERHQTLRAAIDWSYDLLSPSERVLLERLSVFAAGFTLDAAESVGVGDGVGDAEVVDLLAGLVDKSLVMADRSGTPTRYRLLETIRQYAEERLVATGGADEARHAHATYFWRFARGAGRRLWSAEKMAWVARLEPELDNLRLAVSWALSNEDADLALGIAVSMVGQAVERPAWGTALLAEDALRVVGSEAHPLRALVLGEASWAAARRGDTDRAVELCQDAIEAQDQGARFNALAWIYWQAHATYGFEGTNIAGMIDALERAQAEHNVHATVALHAAVATSMFLLGSHPPEEARDHAEQALAAARAAGDPSLITAGLLGRGAAQLYSGQPDRAIETYREALALAEEIGSSWQHVDALRMLTAAEALFGDPGGAVNTARQLLRVAVDIGTTGDRVIGLIYSLGVLARYGHHELCARADGYVSSRVAIALNAIGGMYRLSVADAHTTLGEERYAMLVAEGATADWGALASEIIDVLDDVSARLVIDGR
jgi:predicted ATPase